jgi:hypothetical protein
MEPKPRSLRRNGGRRAKIANLKEKTALVELASESGFSAKKIPKPGGPVNDFLRFFYRAPRLRKQIGLKYIKSAFLIAEDYKSARGGA